MTIVLRSDDMRRRNRLRIIQIVRRGGTVSRGEIAQAATLSPATVSTISSELIVEGVLIARSAETGPSAGRGRPSTSLSVNPQFCHAVLIILKIGAVNVAIVDYAGTVIAREHFHLDMANVTMEDFRDTLITEIRQTWNASGLAAGQLARISIGIQGTTDIAGLRLLRSPMTPLTDIPVAFWLEEEFGVPVRLANDCDLIARALNWRDPERYSDNFAAILLAHGVGMGLFLRGQIINGTRSSGTEFGHMLHQADGALCRCGSNGCIEADAGDYAITRRYRGKPVNATPQSHVEPVEIIRIAEAARAGDALAAETFASAGRALGTGLAGIFALVDPFRIAFVGHGAAAFDLMEPALREVLKNSNASAASNIPIDLYVDEMPLVFEGCGIGALLEIDATQADRVGETSKP
ncbi:MAG: ROK family protein [Hoeflea sp.]|uniref:ROK family protein n=1 Tax=Hoeflea sp. TaxID=1940281 RepID=UPI001D9A2392|nr:ROK family protein [Hoeflea sp.]MBU4529090.1 ROK family protein [Alphaproteobacteria bacterium]MBU4543495.1 ROK family protein [Alphaproteobacteria bacterium]MBU4549120.1 ROK family protein [Alphaproteobacteria bacterium]MBV1725255.1 ROK family protein [Hoeflea sp.]MBV1785216.1 ROK family protein [Hoeflea sp.]